LWAIAQQGDFVSAAMNRTANAPYRISKNVAVKDAPLIEIYRRISETSRTRGEKDR
jgi:hypothetical protein